MKNNKIVAIVLTAFIIIISALVVYAKLCTSQENSIASLGYSKAINSAWTNDKFGVEKCTVSRLNLRSQEDSMSIYYQLPVLSGVQSRTLALHTNNIHFDVYFENNTEECLLYSFGTNNAESLMSKSSGENWHFVNVPPHCSNGRLRMDISSVYHDGSEGIAESYFGISAVILRDILLHSSLPLFLCIILMLIGIFYMLLHLLFNNMLKMRTHLLFIGLTALLTALYSATHLPLTALFINNSYSLYVFEHMLIMIIPIALMLHIQQFYDIQNTKMYQYTYTALMLNFVCQVVICLIGWFDFHQMLFLSHILILFAGYVIMKEAKHDMRAQIEYRGEAAVNKRIMFWGLTIFFASVIIDVIRIYIITPGDASAFSRIGMLIFAATAGIVSIRETSDYSKRAYVSDMLRKMAYTDSMTSLGNRTAFEQALDSTDLKKYECSTIAIIVFDVNSLKYVNDTYGHQNGDRLITSASKAINAIFTDDDFVSFRIGGDEFAAIYTGNETSAFINGKIESFYSYIEKANKNTPDYLKLSIALGAAFMSSAINESMTDLFRRADRIMYDNKSEMKKKLGDTYKRSV